MADINDIKVNWRVYISMKIAGNDTKSAELFFSSYMTTHGNTNIKSGILIFNYAWLNTIIQFIN